MSFDGNGNFRRIYSWVVDAANSVNISSSRTDAEMNGFASGLTNCVTRDGQSPPSADLPMGGKKLVNLGNPTVSTDALNMATGDTRYLLSGITALSLSGSITAGTSLNGATLAISGASSLQAVTTTTISATTVTASGNGAFHDLTASRGDGTGVIYFGTTSGTHFLYWDGTQYNLPAAPLVITTASPGDNSTKAASTGYVVAALGSYAPLASPTFTGTVTTAALTATGTVTATGTLSTGTNANSIGYLGAPQSLHTVSYTLVLTDSAQDQTFNGTTLTCTIPANASVAFPIGTIIPITNINASALTIAITTDTLTWSGTTTAGTRTLAQNGEARIKKITATQWLIGGSGLS